MTTDETNKATPLRSPISFGWETELALRYLRTSRKDGGIALVAIMSFISITLAVMALIAVMSIMAGFRAELMSRLLSFNGHMYVQGQGLQGAAGESLLQSLRGVQGVVSAAPLIEGQTLLRSSGQTSGALVRGLRPGDLPALSYVHASLSEEARRAFGDPHAATPPVLIGKALADSLAIGSGDILYLYAPPAAGAETEFPAGQETAFRVAGTFASGTADFDRAFIFMPLAHAQRFFSRGDAWDVVEIRVEQPDRVGDLHDRLRPAVGADAVVTDWRQRLEGFWRMLSIQKAAMGIILGLVIAIAAMNIAAGIVMLVKNKTRDVAILRTLGASPGAMLRVFFTAGATIGAAGTAAGLVLGLLFCLNIGAIQRLVEGLLGVRLFDSDVYLLETIPALLDAGDVLAVAVWSFLISCVAGLLPALRAARLEPVEALRNE